MDRSCLESEGTIFNIQRYSIHDGPGIRTIVFFKGCPLRCPWCANPESQNAMPEYMETELIGSSVTVGNILSVIEKDLPFYRRSGGGVTLSGGEPAMQPEFAADLLCECKKREINTLIETCGYQKWESFEPVITHTDYVYLDIKIMDPEKHRQVTGISNTLIHENARAMAERVSELTIRVPVIPGYNDDLENLQKTVSFASEIGAIEVQLLPYHRLGEVKYAKLGREYILKGVKEPDRDEIRETASILKAENHIEVRVP